MNPTTAIDALLALTTLAGEILRLTNEVGSIISTAQEQNRDLNADEIRFVIARRVQAFAEWREVREKLYPAGE